MSLYLVVWRRDRSGEVEGMGTDSAHTLRRALLGYDLRAPLAADEVADLARGAQLEADLADPETGHYLGAVTRDGVVELHPVHHPAPIPAEPTGQGGTLRKRRGARR